MATRRPRDKFPLWLHPSGQWCRKHKGASYYFGTDRDAALKRYADEWDNIVAGKPRDGGRAKSDNEDRRLAVVVNDFLTDRRDKVNGGELSEAMWAQYYATCDRVVDHFGRNRTVSDIRPEEFASLRAKVAASVGPVTLLGFVTRTRVLFKFAYDRGLIDQPVKYGNGFGRPSKPPLRKNALPAIAQRANRLVPAGRPGVPPADRFRYDGTNGCPPSPQGPTSIGRSRTLLSSEPPA